MNHDGSLGNAIRMAETAAECGVDAVKFQLHDAQAETTRDAPSPPYFKRETRWEYFERTAFTDEQWATLKQACEHAGIEFLCSVFSVEAVERLERHRRRALQDRLRRGDEPRARARVAATGKPVLLTSGMSSWAELDAAVDAAGDDVTVLQCTSQYPTPPERVGLNVFAELRERYGKPVGFSDHTLGNIRRVRGGRRSARSSSRSTSRSRSDMYGPDARFATEPDELEDLVDGIREIETMLANPVDKDDLAPVAEMKRGLREVGRQRARDPGRRDDLARDGRREEARHRHPRRGCSPRCSAAPRGSTSPRTRSSPRICSREEGLRRRRLEGELLEIKSAMRAIDDAPATSSSSSSSARPRSSTATAASPT